MLPPLKGEAAARAERRLDDEAIIWLTTVGSSGQPQTSPVGFVWDGTTLLIISSPAAPKVRNIRGNPKVSLHLDIERDGEGDGILSIEGVAELDHASPDGAAPLSENERSAYLDRHLDAIRSAGLTPEEAFAELSTAIRVTPTRARSH